MPGLTPRIVGQESIVLDLEVHESPTPGGARWARGTADVTDAVLRIALPLLSGENTGLSVFPVTATPASTEGRDGEGAVNVVTGQTWMKINGAWVAQGSIRGPAGINGTNGLDGLDGRDGVRGPAGRDGTNGTNGTNGTDGFITSPEQLEGLLTNYLSTDTPVRGALTSYLDEYLRDNGIGPNTGPPYRLVELLEPNPELTWHSVSSATVAAVYWEGFDVAAAQGGTPFTVDVRGGAFPDWTEATIIQYGVDAGGLFYFQIGGPGAGRAILAGTGTSDLLMADTAYEFRGVQGQRTTTPVTVTTLPWLPSPDPSADFTFTSPDTGEVTCPAPTSTGSPYDPTHLVVEAYTTVNGVAGFYELGVYDFLTGVFSATGSGLTEAGQAYDIRLSLTDATFTGSARYGNPNSITRSRVVPA